MEKLSGYSCKTEWEIKLDADISQSFVVMNHDRTRCRPLQIVELSTEKQYNVLDLFVGGKNNMV